MKIRMITQPFEAVGYPDLANLPKPITKNIKREFDPMRPWEGLGYSPEDEARNILRTGLNTMWVGNFSFSTLYDNYDSTIFPESSEAGQWGRERKQKISELIENENQLSDIIKKELNKTPKKNNQNRVAARDTTSHKIKEAEVCLLYTSDAPDHTP